MNILLVTHYFDPHVGGIEIVAYNQAKELVKKGHKVTIVTSKLGRERAVEQKEGIRIVRVTAWNLFEEKFGVPYPLFAPRLISTISREVKNNDVIYSHGALYLGSFISSLFAKIYKKPFFVTEHVGFVTYKSSILNVIEKLAFYTLGLATLRASKAAIVLNISVYEWIKQYKKEVHYLPNGVDLRLFAMPTEQEKQDIREKYKIPLDRFVVLFVGRFVSKKGFDVLYNAKDPSYLLVFVGGGVIPESMKSDNSVRILGQLPQEELALLYKASDAFILPSHGEGFPLSIQEAMATGLPIITSKQNNLGLILDSPLITYVDITEADIRSAIKKIQGDIALRKSMGEYSSKTARENFSWEKNVTNLLDLYHKQALGLFAADPANQERERETVFTLKRDTAMPL
jgi:D-inositol-3-phosphate glycosyltransferase